VTVVTILLGFLACAVTSLAFGLLAVRWLRMEVGRWECVCLGYVMGSAITSTLTLAIAWLAWIREAVFVSLTLAAVFVLWRLAPWWRGLKPTRIDSIPVFFRWAFGAAWVVYGVIYFRYALAPEVSPDGTAYHLGLVNLWHHARRLYWLPDMYAALPDGMEMLYLFAFSIGRHSAAALVHFSFLMVLPLLMVLYGIRFGISRGAAPCAAILVFVTPLVGWDGSVAYNDVALAAVVFASVYLLQIWRSEKNTRYLVASSLLAGFAFAIKYTGGFLLLFVMATVIWELRRVSFRRQAQTLFITAAMMAVTPLPYLVRNSVWYGNPVAPFANSIFRNPNFHVSFEQDYVRSQSHLNDVSWSELPRELTLGGPKLGQNLGPIYLLAPIAVAGLLWPQSRILVMAALIVGAGYAGNVSARFLILILPFVWLAAAFVLSRLPRSIWILGALSVAQLVTSLPWVMKHTLIPKIPGPGLNRVWWNMALRIEPEERYLARQSDAYVMAREIESHVPDGETVLSLGGGYFQSYTTRFVMELVQSAQTESARDLLYSNLESATWAKRRFTAVFPEVRARQLVVLQTATDSGMWSVTDIRLWHGNQRIAPPATENLEAFPNPWDIGLAFDGLEATRWRSWERMRPGMHIRVRFPSAQLIDRVDVLSDDFQWFSDMDIRILTEKGEWVCPLSARWRVDPPADLRKEASEALKRRGIHYVLIARGVPEEAAYRNNLAAWGMHKVVSTQDATLYQIE
jgi:hypothetical protein